MTKSNSVEILANKARNSIGEYCMNECNSLCCRKGHITLTDKELMLLKGDKVIEISEIEITSPGTNKYA